MSECSGCSGEQCGPWSICFEMDKTFEVILKRSCIVIIHVHIQRNRLILLYTTQVYQRHLPDHLLEVGELYVHWGLWLFAEVRFF